MSADWGADLGNIISGLWGFLSAWRSLFDRFDEDSSGNISYEEYTNALIGTSRYPL
jgi:hypothetical protein